MSITLLKSRQLLSLQTATSMGIGSFFCLPALGCCSESEERRTGENHQQKGSPARLLSPSRQTVWISVACDLGLELTQQALPKAE